MVAFHVIYFDRAESSETYMKSHMSDIDAFFLYFFKKLFSKVQSCCRCCCGAFVLCINCLITVLIFQFMCNIRRQRHFAKLIQDFLITGRDIPDQSYADSLCETLYTKLYDQE